MDTLAPTPQSPDQITRADSSTEKTAPPSYTARGAATEYDRNKYYVGYAAYPEDLLTNEQYGGNYVVFYINIHEDSMLASGENAVPTVTGNIPPRAVGELRGANFNQSATDIALTGAAGLAGYKTNLGGKLSGLAGKATGSNLAQPVADLVSKGANVAVGAGAAAIAVNTLGGTKKEYKRLQQSIALHLPTDLSTRYSMQWDEADLAGSTAILAVAENMGSALKDAIFSGDVEGLYGKSKALANYGTSQAVRLPGIGEAISKTSGVAANPKKEQLFKQVDFRTFSFTYMFFPKSEKEAQHVQKIIKLFKLHMHPEFKKNSYNFMYTYPSEFDIYYYHKGKENLNLHRHTSCVLTDMSVLYTPQGTVTMLPGGMPSQINVTLTFKELAILTKENIQDNF